MIITCLLSLDLEFWLVTNTILEGMLARFIVRDLFREWHLWVKIIKASDTRRQLDFSLPALRLWKWAVRKTRFVICFLGMSASILLWIVSNFQYKYRFSVFKWDDKYNMNVVINAPVIKRIILYCLQMDWWCFL